MTPSEISAILGVAGTVFSLAEKYGPEVYETVIDAIRQTRDKKGPTAADVNNIFMKCVADNQAIQDS